MHEQVTYSTVCSVPILFPSAPFKSILLPLSKLRLRNTSSNFHPKIYSFQCCLKISLKTSKFFVRSEKFLSGSQKSLAIYESHIIYLYGRSETIREAIWNKWGISGKIFSATVLNDTQLLLFQLNTRASSRNISSCTPIAIPLGKN